MFDHIAVRSEIQVHQKQSPELGPRRHLEQQASLIGTMASVGLLAPGRCFIEFGAGKGKLLHYIRLAVEKSGASAAVVATATDDVDNEAAPPATGGGASTPQVKLSLARAAIDAGAALAKEQPGTSPVEAAAHALDSVAGKEPAAAASGDGEPQPQLQTDYLAVDRTNTRRNFDRFHVQNELSRRERVLIDIEHLVLSKVPLIQNGTKPLVVVGKHLCGAATDLSLVCSMDEGRAAAHEPAAAVLDGGGGGGGGGSSGDAAHPVEGMVIALCCHQVCEWHRYCNPSFFSDVLKFSATDFKHIALMSSWAVCGERGEASKHASSVQRAVAASVPAPDEHAAGDFDQSVAASRKREPLRNRESARGH